MTVAELEAEFPLRSVWDCDGEIRHVVGHSHDRLMMATGPARAESVTFVNVGVARTCRRVEGRGL